MIPGGSPGNVQATYPFLMIAMDHIPSLPKSFKEKTELLLWVDLLSGYVVAGASASRTAQSIAEGYKECVFPRFEASEAIQPDRNLDSCHIASEHLTRSPERSNVLLWLIALKRMAQQNTSSDSNSSHQGVCRRCGSKGLG